MSRGGHTEFGMGLSPVTGVLILGRYQGEGPLTWGRDGKKWVYKPRNVRSLGDPMGEAGTRFSPASKSNHLCWHLDLRCLYSITVRVYYCCLMPLSFWYVMADLGN